MGKARIKFHTVSAIVVLIAVGAWVATGEFSFVGSDMADAAQAPATEPVTPAPAAPAGAAAEALQTVAYITAAPSGHVRRIWISGQTEPDKRVVLVARSSGMIANLPIAEGESLAEGDTVMALDGPEKRAAVEAARAQLDIATHEAESNERLHREGTVPSLRLEASIAAREAARSAFESARAEVDRLEVRAPFAGIVDHVAVEVGSWVQPGTEVATLLSLDPIVVVGEIGERDLQSVGKGTRAAVAFGDGTTAEGEVRYVRREATGLTRTFPIEVAISNPDAVIPAGMSADITLSVETDPAVVLQRSAITLDTDGALGVRVLREDGTADFLKVEILDDTTDGLVVSGVPKGTRIIVSGQDMVSNGEKVAAVEATAEAAGERDTN